MHLKNILFYKRQSAFGKSPFSLTISDFADYIFDDSTIVDTQAKYAEKNNEETSAVKSK